jgi:DNA-binding NarL/FixJ family response regulator
MIKILMYEDNKRFRESVQQYFEDADDISIVASYTTADNALEQILRHTPDVILMDIEMPSQKTAKENAGLDALSEIKAHYPATKIMMLTSFYDETRIFRAICNGASGYMIKGDNIELIEKAIVDVSGGGGYLTPSIAMKVMLMLKNPPPVSHADYKPKLTSRQQEILQKMVEGKPRKNIALELHLALETVNEHIDNIYRKLHVNSATEAVSKAILKGLV